MILSALHCNGTPDSPVFCQFSLNPGFEFKAVFRHILPHNDTYDLKGVVTISCVQFALFFVDFWFQLARWIDSTILDALYGSGSPHSNYDPLMGLNNAFGDMLLNFVMASMFIILPTFWISALTWAGIRAGGIAQNLVNGSKDGQSAGAKGSSVLMKMGK